MMDRPQHGAMEGLYIQKEQAEIRVKRNRNKALSAKSLCLPVFPSHVVQCAGLFGNIARVKILQ